VLSKQLQEMWTTSAVRTLAAPMAPRDNPQVGLNLHQEAASPPEPHNPTCTSSLQGQHIEPHVLCGL